MDALRTLAGIRENRLRQAQSMVYLAHQKIEEKVQQIDAEKKALEEYERELPDLIKQLYLEVLGRKVDVALVTDKVQMENRLIQKKQDYLVKISALEGELRVAQEELAVAQANLLKQERKKEGMQEMLKEERLHRFVEEERKLGKVIDELASLKHVRK